MGYIARRYPGGQLLTCVVVDVEGRPELKIVLPGNTGHIQVTYLPDPPPPLSSSWIEGWSGSTESTPPL